MKASDAINLDDLRRAARRRLPRLAFDFIEGGVEDELGLARNRAAFDRYALVPRYLVDVSKPTTRTELFGRAYAMPVGISPMGMCGMFRKDADLAMAAAAAAADVPYIMSSASSSSLEEAVAVARDSLWFQIYGTLKRDITYDLIGRADAAGVSVLVVTVDVPVPSKRERNRRNGFTRPLRLSRKAFFDVVLHPAWLWGYWANGGLPMLGNLAPYARPGATADDVADLFSAQTPAADQVWDDIAAYRKRWHGPLVLKGILHPADAARARALGVDGLIVSNHGGRQLDRAPAALEMLAPIRRAAGDGMVLMLDGGVRRGAEVLIARALGAACAFVGRPVLYGAAAFATEGAARALAILREEIRTTMAQIGLADGALMGPDRLLDGATGALMAEEPAAGGFGPRVAALAAQTGGA